MRPWAMTWISYYTLRAQASESHTLYKQADMGIHEVVLISATKMYCSLRMMKGKITMLYVTFMLRFSTSSLLKEKMSESQSLLLPLASEMERNCWRSWNVFSLTHVWSYKATSPNVCRWQRNWSLSTAFVESGLYVSSRYICDLCNIANTF